jgi:hypothetical protein
MSNGAPETNSTDPLKGRSPDDVLDDLEDALRGVVLRAYYYGSFMTNTFGRNSDIDLILIQDTDTAFVDRPMAFDFLSAIAENIDILVYTPAEFEKLTTDPAPGFWYNVTKHMVRFL